MIAVLAWLGNIASHPLVASLLVPAFARAIGDFLESHANRLEEKAAIIQAKAAGKIEDNAKRAEAMREASRKLSDSTRRP